MAEGGGRPRKNNRLEMETTIRSLCYRAKASMIGPVNRATQVITIRFERIGLQSGGENFPYGERCFSF